MSKRKQCGEGSAAAQSTSLAAQRAAAEKLPMAPASDAHMAMLADLLGGCGLGESAADVVKSEVQEWAGWRAEYNRNDPLWACPTRLRASVKKCLAVTLPSETVTLIAELNAVVATYKAAPKEAVPIPEGTPMTHPFAMGCQIMGAASVANREALIFHHWTDEELAGLKVSRSTLKRVFRGRSAGFRDTAAEGDDEDQARIDQAGLA